MELNSNYDLLISYRTHCFRKDLTGCAIARRIGGEIISADSRQVYRGMNIGTGKDYDDYLLDGRRIPCHLIDIADPGYKYNVFEYQRDFIRVYTSLKDDNIFPVVCGGSGMYADSIISGYRMVEVAPDSGLRSNLEKKSMEELIEIFQPIKNFITQQILTQKKGLSGQLKLNILIRISQNLSVSFPEIRSLVVGILS